MDPQRHPAGIAKSHVSPPGVDVALALATMPEPPGAPGVGRSAVAAALRGVDATCRTGSWTGALLDAGLELAAEVAQLARVHTEERDRTAARRVAAAQRRSNAERRRAEAIWREWEETTGNSEP